MLIITLASGFVSILYMSLKDQDWNGLTAAAFP